MSALSDWTTQGEFPVVDFWGERIRIGIEPMCVIPYEPNGPVSTVVSRESFDTVPETRVIKQRILIQSFLFFLFAMNEFSTL
jgi:hypothetical protein